MILRRATEADAPLLAELERRSFSDPWREETLASHLAGEWGRGLIAEADGVAVGYFLGQVLPPEGEVFRVAALPEYRRQGVGRSLLSLFLEEEIEMSLCFLEVREGNLAARGLYEALGFRQVGLRRRYYKNPTEDAWVMKWERS